VDMKTVEGSPIIIVSPLGNAIIPSAIGMYNYKSIYQGGGDVDLYQKLLKWLRLPPGQKSGG